jgi:hypothetical protein
VERTERTSLPDVLEAVQQTVPGALVATPAKRRPVWAVAAVLGVLVVFAGGVATGRMWTQGSVPRPAAVAAAVAVAPASTQAPPPSIEAPEVLPEVAELAMPSTTSVPVAAPPVTVAALQRPSPTPAVAMAEDDNPY